MLGEPFYICLVLFIIVKIFHFIFNITDEEEIKKNNELKKPLLYKTDAEERFLKKERLGTLTKTRDILNGKYDEKDPPLAIRKYPKSLLSPTSSFEN